MIGAVLRLELLRGGRRGRLESWQRLYTGWLVVQFCFYFSILLSEVWASMLLPPYGPGRMDVTAFGRFTANYLEAFVVQQFVLLFLLAPAFVAGAITDEKSAGTLQELLGTHLSAWDIILGKLLGRVSQLAYIALAGVPLLCLAMTLSGMNLLTLVALAAFTVLLLLGLAAASILVSVWSRQTRNAIIALYSVGGGGYLLLWAAHTLPVTLNVRAPGGPAAGWVTVWASRFDDVLRYFDARFVLQPAWEVDINSAELGRRLLICAACWGSVTAICVALAVWRLRPAYLRQLEGEGTKKKEAWWRRRQVHQDEPIQWKERDVEGVAPLPVLRCVPRWLALTAVFLGTLVASLSYLQCSVPLDALLSLLANGQLEELSARVANNSAIENAFWQQSLTVLLLATLVVGIRCSGSISGERERQTWEALLLTPLPIRELVRGKMFGNMAATRAYLVAYALPAFGVAWLVGPVPVCWTLLGLLLVLPAMYFVGGAGMWYSVTSQASWRSLLATLAVGYLGGFLICSFTIPVIGCLAMIVGGVLILLAMLIGGDSQMANLLSARPALSVGLFLTLVWGWIFWRVGRSYLLSAQKWVIGRERTPYWKSGENCGYAVERYLTQWENKNA